MCGIIQVALQRILKKTIKDRLMSSHEFFLPEKYEKILLIINKIIKPIIPLLVISICLIIVPDQACARQLCAEQESQQYKAENYNKSILLARTQANHKNYKGAIKTMKVLLKKYPNNYEILSLLDKYKNDMRLSEMEVFYQEKKYQETIDAGSLLFINNIDRYFSGITVAKSQFRLGKISEAKKMYKALVVLYPKDASIKQELERMSALEEFQKVAKMIKKGKWKLAIQKVKPFYYIGSPVEKIAGELLVHAYKEGGENKKAIIVYKELLKKYPNDSQLSADYMNFLVNAYHNGSALNYYRSIPEKNKAALNKKLGQGLAPFYTNSMMIYGGAARSTRNYPVDDLIGFLLTKSYKNSALNISVSSFSRFNEKSTQIEATYYFKLSNGYAGYIGAGYSPENNFLAHYSFLLGLSKSIKNVSIYGSVRQLKYTALNPTVLSGGLRYYFNDPVSLGLTMYYVPQTNGYSVVLSPEWEVNNKNKLYGNVSWGMAGENLGVSLGILNTPSSNINIGYSYRITPHTSIGAETFLEYRKALYNRVGGLGYLRYWW